MMLGVFKSPKRNDVVKKMVEPILRDSKHRECKYVLNLSATDNLDGFKLLLIIECNNRTIKQ